MDSKEWFASWFDTSYYHSLYKNRDEGEAKRFIQNLAGFLSLKPQTKVLDLACGKGRHSVTLNEIGMDVLGVDLSAHSIQLAKISENHSLHFQVHDMREIIHNVHFDAVFNLFTSFGYFSYTKDNERVLLAVHQMLNENGLLILDFMNSKKIVANLVPQELKTVDGINYHITRSFDGNRIHKKIEFTDKGKDFSFSECVQALQLEDFTTLLANQKFQIIHTFGDFDLHSFDEEKSDRLILIARKK